MRPSRATTYTAGTAAHRWNRVITRIGIYPAFQAAVPVFDYHHNLNPGGSQPAEHSFAELSAGHWLLASGSPKETESGPTYRDSSLYHLVAPNIAGAVFGDLGSCGLGRHIADANQIFWMEQMPP